MTIPQTPKQIVTERWEWAQTVRVVTRDEFEDAIGVATADQIHAASDEAGDNMNDLAAAAVRGEHRIEDETNPDTIRTIACLIQYAFDRAVWTCPHAKDAKRPRPLKAIMGADIIKCDDCLPPIIRDQHPGACEYCDTPTERFFPNAFSFTHVNVLADCCESCADELKELLA